MHVPSRSLRSLMIRLQGPAFLIPELPVLLASHPHALTQTRALCEVLQLWRNLWQKLWKPFDIHGGWCGSWPLGLDTSAGRSSLSCGRFSVSWKGSLARTAPRLGCRMLLGLVDRQANQGVQWRHTIVRIVLEYAISSVARGFHIWLRRLGKESTTKTSTSVPVGETAPPSRITDGTVQRRDGPNMAPSSPRLPASTNSWGRKAAGIASKMPSARFIRGSTALSASPSSICPRGHAST